MADVDDERYEDEETTDFAQEVEEQSADNHHVESEQPIAGDDSQPELQKQSEEVDATADSDKRFDADAPSPVLCPPGETQENTDQNTTSEEGVEKNSTSRDGEDEGFSQPALSNLDR